MKSAVKRIKGILLALMYVALYYVVSLGVYLAYYTWNLADGSLSIAEIEKSAFDGTYALTVIASIVCFWVYMLIGKLRGKPVSESINTRRVPPIIYCMSVSLAVGCRFLVAVYYSLSQKSDVLLKSIENAAQNTPEIISFSQMLIALFAVAVVAPLFEELLFRGLVMGQLMTIMRPWAAITLQAIIFGVAHGVLFQSIFAFAVGVVLGIVYYRTQSIASSAVCHCVFNLSAILMQETMSVAGIIIYSVSGILLLLLSLFYIFDNSKKDN